MKHKPIIIDGTYLKTEMDDDFLFRKTMSISINAEQLEKCHSVVITILHRGVKIRATKQEIKDEKMVFTFKSEVKYYYPVSKWEVIEGNKNWVEDLK